MPFLSPSVLKLSWRLAPALKTHGSSGNHRVEKEMVRNRVEYPCRNRDTQCVVDHGKEEILADVPHGKATELNGLHDASEVTFD